MTKAAIYARISDDREGRALGVERQEADCRALAMRLGLAVVGIYCDNDISASTRSRKERPRYRQLLLDAAAGEFRVVVAATSSRITRKPREFEDLIDLAESHGVRFEFDKSPRFDLNTADGRMMARIMAAADAAEAERIGERTARKLAERAAAGKPHGGQRPYGWEPDRMTIRESEAEIIRWGVSQTLGGVPLRTQFRELNERGVGNSRGGAWTHSTYRGVLTTARHAGLMPDGSPAMWPAIVSPDHHRALVRLLSAPERVTTPGRGGKLHLLSGLARCGLCGGPLRVGKGKGGPVYRCYPSGEIQRSKEHLDALVLRVIAERLRLPDAVRLLSEAEDDEARVARQVADERAQRLRLRLDEAAEQFAAEGITGSQLRTISARLRAELSVAEAAAAPPRPRDAALGEVLRAPDPGAAFLALPVDRQRPIVELLLSIKVGRGSRGNVFRPDGIDMDWV